MTTKSSHLIERAAAQLLKSGSVDSSVAGLLDQDRQPAAITGRLNATPTNLPPSSPPLSPNLIAPIVDGNAATTTLVPGDTVDPATTLTNAEAPAIPAIQIVSRTSLDHAGLIDWEQSRSRISEEFRLSQRQILRNAASPENAGNGNLILITSSRPGEGKSFISLNLAASIARQRDHDVLLVDVDYKPDSIGTKLGLAGNRGLLDLVTDPSLDPDQLIVRTAIPNLSILPIGRNGERSPELFASRQATRLIQSLGRRYADRLVVLDAPPCLATSEPGALAPIVGQVVLVVEAEKTQREEVETALDLIQTCPTITLLLNKVQRNNRYGFGAYSASYAQPYSL